MMSTSVTRKVALTAGASALVGMGMLTACGTKEKPAEAPAPSPPAATASVAPSEKSVPGAINPGPNSGDYQKSFAPTVSARPAPTALPGNVITGG